MRNEKRKEKRKIHWLTVHTYVTLQQQEEKQ
jgi:hypothetical protein